MTENLRQYKALTMDCYGTLIDWESGIWDALQPLLLKNNRRDITRQIALEAHAVIESDQQAETPGMIYPQILATVHIAFARQFNLETTDDLNEAFGKSVAHWPAFPDAADALRRLQQHFKLVILSNIDNHSFAASNSKLGVKFDAIYTAQDMGAYKPTPANFDYMLEKLEADHNILAGEILHTAQSLFHDHVPAKNIGLSSAWIDRQNLSEGENWGATARVDQRPEVDFIFPTMQALADAVD
jgi:2-haloacid dehalogenase